MIWIVALMVFIMLTAAIAVLLVDSLISAVAATSAISLALSVIFVLLNAPDVAMTEAVVGSGLSSVILALTLFRLNVTKQKNNETTAEQDDA